MVYIWDPGYPENYRNPLSSSCLVDQYWSKTQGVVCVCVCVCVCVYCFHDCCVLHFCFGIFFSFFFFLFFVDYLITFELLFIFPVFPLPAPDHHLSTLTVRQYSLTHTQPAPNKPPQYQGSPFPWIPDNSIISYILIQSHGWTHVQTLGGCFIRQSSEGSS